MNRIVFSSVLVVLLLVSSAVHSTPPRREIVVNGVAAVQQPDSAGWWWVFYDAGPPVPDEMQFWSGDNAYEVVQVQKSHGRIEVKAIDSYDLRRGEHFMGVKDWLATKRRNPVQVYCIKAVNPFAATADPPQP
jgi:hypothetical protein